MRIYLIVIMLINFGLSTNIISNDIFKIVKEMIHKIKINAADNHGVYERKLSNEDEDIKRIFYKINETLINKNLQKFIEYFGDKIIVIGQADIEFEEEITKKKMIEKLKKDGTVYEVFFKENISGNYQNLIKRLTNNEKGIHFEITKDLDNEGEYIFIIKKDEKNMSLTERQMISITIKYEKNNNFKIIGIYFSYRDNN